MQRPSVCYKASADTTYDQKGLKIVHLNVRSLLPKIESINIWLSNLPVDILMISETWFNPDIDCALTNLNGYTCIRHDRISFVNYVKKDFQEQLAQQDWSTFSSTLDKNEKWTKMAETINSVADIFCPYRDHKGKKYVPPWLDQEILETLKARDDCYKKGKKI